MVRRLGREGGWAEAGGPMPQDALPGPVWGRDGSCGAGTGVAAAPLETPPPRELLEVGESFRARGWAGPVQSSQAWSPVVELQGARQWPGLGTPELIQGLFSVTQPCPGACDGEAQYPPRDGSGERCVDPGPGSLGCRECVPQAQKAAGGQRVSALAPAPSAAPASVRWFR